MSPEPSDRSIKDRLKNLIPVLLSIVILYIAGHYSYLTYGMASSTDIDRYATCSLTFIHGGNPYARDGMEYPPLALIPMVICRLLAFSDMSKSHHIYAAWFLFISCVTIGAAIYVCSIMRRAQTPLAKWGIALFIIVNVLMLISFIPWRYDFFPALLTLIALYCIIRGRHVLSALVLSIALGAKFYPMFVIPIMVAYLWVRRGRLEALKYAGIITVACLIIFLPFIIANPKAYNESVKYQTERGLQLESVASGLVLTHITGDKEIGYVENDHRASGVRLKNGHKIILAFEMILVISYVFFMWLLYNTLKRTQDIQDKIDIDLLNYAILSVILLSLVTSRIFSPQYVAWFIPFAPLIRHPVKRITFAIVLLTGMIYPFAYHLLMSGHPMGVMLLNARNLLVAVFCVCCIYRVYHIGKLPQSSQSTPSSLNKDEVEITA